MEFKPPIWVVVSAAAWVVLRLALRLLIAVAERAACAVAIAWTCVFVSSLSTVVVLASELICVEVSAPMIPALNPGLVVPDPMRSALSRLLMTVAVKAWT